MNSLSWVPLRMSWHVQHLNPKPHVSLLHIIMPTKCGENLPKALLIGTKFGFLLTNGLTHGSFFLRCRIEIALVSYTYSTLLAKLNLFIGHIKLLHVLINQQIRIVLVHSLVGNYVQKNHSWNWMRFYWPTWTAIAKWLHIFFLILRLQFKKKSSV